MDGDESGPRRASPTPLTRPFEFFQATTHAWNDPDPRRAQHNLKNVTLDLPRDRLIVVTGISGSGKSSLAFDTIYAEGQRRYVESLSAYARQFLEQMEKPDVDSIEGLSPAIAIEQKTLGRNPRSTVGTVTEIYDYLRLLFARVGEPHCYRCGAAIGAQTIQQIVDRIARRCPRAAPARARAGRARPQGRVPSRSSQELRRAGFVRVRIDGERARARGGASRSRSNSQHTIEVVVDRAGREAGDRARVWPTRSRSRSSTATSRSGRRRRAGDGASEMIFSQRFACPACGVSYPELTPRMFSFNSPYGACPACGGLGAHTHFDPDLVVPDERLSLRQGAIAPWGRKPAPYHLCAARRALGRALGFDLDTPFAEISRRRHATRSSTARETRQSRSSTSARAKSAHLHAPFEGVLGSSRSAGARRRDRTGCARSSARFWRTRPCPSVQGDAAPAGGGACDSPAGRSSRSRALGGRGEALLRRARAAGGRKRRSRGASSRRSARASASCVERRARLPDARPLRGDALRRRGPAHPPRHPDRREPRRRALHPRRAVDRPAPARQRAAAADARRAARPRQHGDRGRARPRHDPRGRPRRSTWGPAPAMHGGHVVAEGTPGAVMANAALAHRRLPLGAAIDRGAAPAARRGNGWALARARRARQQPARTSTVAIPLGTMTCVTGVSGSGKSTLVVDTLYRALAQQLRRQEQGPRRRARRASTAGSSSTR